MYAAHRHPVIILMLVAVCAASSRAAVWTVDPDGGGDFRTIQAAIAGAAAGDEIRVLPGTYAERLDFLGKDLWVHSTAGPDLTVITGETGGGPSLVTFAAGESEAARLEGFQLSAGSGTFHTRLGRTVGGAAYCSGSSPTFSDCRFVENSCGFAAGIYVESSHPQILDCAFIENTAETHGSAIAGSESAPTIRGCLFDHNLSETGAGAISLTHAAVIEQCLFASNKAAHGAALNLAAETADFVVRDCSFESNWSLVDHGGAIRCHEASPLIEECVFVDNRAVRDGGAIMFVDGGQATVRRCTFHGNLAQRSGAHLAIWWFPEPYVENCTFTGGVMGGGIFVDAGAPVFICNDAWNNFGGNYWGYPDPTGENGNISVDPLYCDPDFWDFHLRSDSPCAEENNPECGRIGARDVGCDPPTGVAGTSWGRLKARFRE